MSLFYSSGRLAFVLATALTAWTPAAAKAPQAQEAAKAVVSLKVGDPAPAFTPGTWLKGEPVPSLAKGQVYVLEFWATWCGACKAAIPHVTELARKYGDKVTFIGVDVLETGNSLEEKEAKAAAFVKAQGGKMDYRVCRDTPGEAFATRWLKAAGQEGIPATFIVDGTGRLVWMGHPGAMEPIVKKLAAGTFDFEAERARAEEQKKVDAAIGQAIVAKDYQKVLDLLPGLKPENEVGILWKGFYRFEAQLHLDPKAAAARYEEVVKQGPLLTAEFYSNIVVRTEGLTKDWYRKTYPVYRKRLKQEPTVIHYLAKAQYLAGDYAAAAKSKAGELAVMKARVPEILKDHPDAGDMIQKELAKLEAELKDYRALAAKKH